MLEKSKIKRMVEDCFTFDILDMSVDKISDAVAASIDKVLNSKEFVEHISEELGKLIKHSGRVR